MFAWGYGLLTHGHMDLRGHFLGLEHLGLGLWSLLGLGKAIAAVNQKFGPLFWANSGSEIGRGQRVRMCVSEGKGGCVHVHVHVCVCGL